MKSQGSGRGVIRHYPGENHDRPQSGSEPSTPPSRVTAVLTCSPQSPHNAMPICLRQPSNQTADGRQTGQESPPSFVEPEILHLNTACGQNVRVGGTYRYH
jgi:hypothetical protein